MKWRRSGCDRPAETPAPAANNSEPPTKPHPPPLQAVKKDRCPPRYSPNADLRIDMGNDRLRNKMRIPAPPEKATQWCVILW